MNIQFAWVLLTLLFKVVKVFLVRTVLNKLYLIFKLNSPLDFIKKKDPKTILRMALSFSFSLFFRPSFWVP